MTAWRDHTPAEALKALGRNPDGTRTRTAARPRHTPVTVPEVTEADWQAKILGYARLRGWQDWHDNDSRRNDAGLPDLILWHPTAGGHLMVEVKKQTGRLRPAQARTIASMRAAGIEVHIWRPSDWAAVQLRLDNPTVPTPMEPIR